MTNELIPRSELAPPSVSHLPLATRIALWNELVDESEALLLAGLRAKIGPDSDLDAAYREWNQRQMDRRERELVMLLENLSRREGLNGE